MTGIRASQKEKKLEPTPLPHMRLWFDILQKIGYPKSTKGILYRFSGLVLTVFGIVRFLKNLFCFKIRFSPAQHAITYFLGVGKHFRLLMQPKSTLHLFSLDHSMKVLTFSKTVHTIFMKICTVILHTQMRNGMKIV